MVSKRKPSPKKKISKDKSQESKLTLKQRKFLKYYLESGNITQSALKAGYALGQSGFENLQKPLIQFAYQKLLDKNGITDERLNKVLDEGLGSTKVIGYLHQYKKKKGGKIEKVQPDEVISSEFLDVPDHPTRHKYLETGLKLKERLNTKEKIEVTGEVSHKHFIAEAIKKSKTIGGKG